MINEQKPIKVIIADDHDMFVEGLLALLNYFPEIKVIASVRNGREALDQLPNNEVDVVITDIDMPVMNGLDLIKEIKKHYPTIKILALTMHDQVQSINAIIKLGAEGYLLKNTNKEELRNAIHAVARGETFYSEEVKSAIMNNISPIKKVKHFGAFPELSKREKDVLKLICEAYSQHQIADKLFISENTVITHKRSLFSKLNVNNTVALINAAKEKGLID